MAKFKYAYQLIVISAALVHHASMTVVQVAYDRTKVWGPGLKANAQLPSRYVYVQLYDTQGTMYVSFNTLNTNAHIFPLILSLFFHTSISHSHGQIGATLALSDGSKFIGRTHIMDRKDGSYIINFRPIISQKDVELTIKLDGKHLGKSPYKIKGIYFILYQYYLSLPTGGPVSLIPAYWWTSVADPCLLVN